MNSTTNHSKSLSLLVPLGALVAGYLLDISALALKAYSSSTFRSMPSILFHLLLPAIVSLGFLALAWFLLRPSSFTRGTAYSYLAFGMAGFLTFLSNFFPFPAFLRFTVLWRFRAKLGSFGFDSVYFWVSNFLLVLGIAGLAVRRKR